MECLKVAVIGSRDTGDIKLEHLLAHIPLNTSLLISGGAAGIDSYAEEAARILKLPIRVILPDYVTFGRQAPLVRNRQIVQAADLVLAFWDTHSRGTAHALRCCIETETPFRIYPFRMLIQDVSHAGGAPEK